MGVRRQIVGAALVNPFAFVNNDDCVKAVGLVHISC